MTNAKFDEISEKRVVAYLDILGVNGASNRNDLLEILEEISKNNNDGNIEKGPPVTAEGLGVVGESYKIIPTFSSFSDSIIISYEREAEPFNNCSDATYIASVLSDFNNLLADLSILCLKKGYLIRGAVDFGKVYHVEKIANGDAVDIAVAAEKNFAIYPRIVLCQNLIDNLFPNFMSFKDLGWLNRDMDGVYYMNWLTRIIRNFDMLKIKDSVIKEILAYIEKGLKSNIKKSQKEYAKWCWMGNYINNSLFFKKSGLSEIKLPTLIGKEITGWSLSEFKK